MGERRSIDVEVVVAVWQIMLCTTLNPFIATGALIIPSSIYAILKVRRFGGSPTTWQWDVMHRGCMGWLPGGCGLCCWAWFRSGPRA